jgi:fatty acid desaturase
MTKNQKRNIPWVIAFFSAFISGGLAFFITLGANLPAYVALPVLIYIISSVALWFIENKNNCNS